MKTVGQRIRDARKKRGLTLKQLGEATGDAFNNLSRYERDEVEIPREKVPAIAAVLGVEVGHLELGLEPTDAPLRTPDDPVLAAFLATPEGATVTPDELSELCRMGHGRGKPTLLAYHFALMHLRALEY